ncbi:MAG: response regulator, partial [Corynebacterium sp.]
MSKNTRDLQVLVVDDDFRVAQIHADVVTATAGLQVQGTARTVAEARRMITAQAPDLLLADVYLPDGVGIDLVRAAGVDAVVLSAAAEPATVRRALSAGVHGYLVKPFTRQSLTERLERVVRFRRIVDTPHLLKQEEIDRALSLLHGSAQPASATAWATEQLVLAAVGDEE